MNNKIRVLRTLEYIGDRDNIERGLASRQVKGTSTKPKGYIINEAIIGELTEMVPSIEDKKEIAIDFISKVIFEERKLSDRHIGLICFTSEELAKVIADLIDHLGY